EPAERKHTSKTTAILSFAQRRLWLVQQLGLNSVAYNIPYWLRLQGPLDGAILERCLQEIARRHDVLRTTYHLTDGEPIQRVETDPSLSLGRLNLSHLPAVERERNLSEALNGMLRRPFDLTCDLMLRAELIRLGEQDHVLGLALHHIASDGWSLGV